MTTEELLAEHAELMNEHGADSSEVEEFLNSHKFNSEFYELACLGKKLKKALVHFRKAM